MVTNFVKRNLSKFGRNRSGIAYIWAVCFLSICFIPFIYWALTIALDKTAAAIFTQYALVGSPLQAWLLVKVIISVGIPVIMIVAPLIWATVNSKAKAYE